MHSIQIQQVDFDLGREYARLAQGAHNGAVVTFVGRVREFDDTGASLWLEHYPGMTEKSLAKIAEEACARWPVDKVRIVHRVGELPPGAQIVFVGVASGHRQQAFRACEFIMDLLKTEAPFWKKEGDHWVEAKADDQRAADGWYDTRA